MPRKVARPEGVEQDWEKRSAQLRRQAALSSPGAARDEALDLAEKLDAACRMRDWLKPSPKGLVSG